MQTTNFGFHSILLSDILWFYV